MSEMLSKFRLQAGIALLFAIVHHRSGLPEPGRSPSK